MYDIYRYIFVGGLILSVVFLLISVFLFFFLNIRDAIGDITGSNKRKAMEKVKSGQAFDKKDKRLGEKKNVPSSRTSSQLTARMSIQDRYNAMDGNDETSVLPSKKPSPAVVDVKPPAQSAKPAEVTYKPVSFRDPGFTLEADITYIHSSEVIA